MRKAAILVLLSVASLTAQTAAERRQAILNYQLTTARANQLITALEGMTKYIVSLPDAQERMRKTAGLSTSEQTAKMESDPKASAILKQNGLTAREYVIGIPTLRMALMAAQGLTGDFVIVSPANLAFVKAHFAGLKPKMDAADGLMPRK